MFRFQSLEIYKKSKVFHLSCKKLLKQSYYDKYTADQLTRASFSVVLNIAESSGRFTKLDRRKYLIISRSSAFESAAALDVMHDSETITTQQYEQLLANAEEISTILYTMIGNLSK